MRGQLSCEKCGASEVRRYNKNDQGNPSDYVRWMCPCISMTALVASIRKRMSKKLPHNDARFLVYTRVPKNPRASSSPPEVMVVLMHAIPARLRSVSSLPLDAPPGPIERPAPHWTTRVRSGGATIEPHRAAPSRTRRTAALCCASHRGSLSDLRGEPTKEEIL